MITELLTLFASQLVFTFSRTMSVRYTAMGRVWGVIISGVFIKGTWLISSYIGVKAMFDKDPVMIIAYVLSGVVGEYIAMRIKIR